MSRLSYFGETHRLLRDTVSRFVEREILPHIDDWEEAESFPRELYEKAGAAGLLGIGYPEKLGGSEGDIFQKLVFTEEIMRTGSGGLTAGLGSLDIALPPIVHFGSDELKQRVVPPVLRGEKIAALAITEPNAGSGCCRYPDSSCKGRGFLPGQWCKNIYHQWLSGRLLHRSRAYRR